MHTEVVPKSARRRGARLVSRPRTWLACLAAALVAIPAPSFAQAPTFNTFVSSAKGGEPWFQPGYAANGDFNNDGKLDAMVSDGGPNLRLMIGTGSGTFYSVSVGVPATNPNQIRAADFNGDGRLDAVTVSNGAWPSPMTVVINTGNDGIGVPQFTVTNYNPAMNEIRSVSVGDLNGDGSKDIIIGNAYGGLKIYLNNGSGVFSVSQSTSLQPGGGSTGYGEIADVNGDGKADFVVASSQTINTNVFLGNGDGTLQTTPINIASTSSVLDLADINKDGRPDLLEVGGTSLKVYLNLGGGNFGSPTQYTLNGPASVTAADINGDGNLDAVVSTTGNNSVAVLLGNGAGGFGSPYSFAVNNIPLDVGVGDYNGDGKIDIATVGLGDRSYGVLMNTTPAPLPTQTLTIPGGFGNVGDFAPNVEYFNPVTNKWQPAYLTSYAAFGHPGGHPWGKIPGTNNWINYKPSGGSDPGAGPTQANTLWYTYRVRFTVPADAQNPKMTFSIKADNFAQVDINGVSAGSLITGEANNVNADAVFSQNVNVGENIITIDVGDFGGLNGFNFRIDLSVQSATPLEIVPVPTDTTPPVINVPANITAEATSSNGAAVSFNATAVDNIDGSVPVVASPASGSTFPLGTTPVGLAASDAAGNTATASFNVTVGDTTAPNLLVPSDVTAEAASAAGTAVTYPAAIASDAVGVTSLTYSAASGSTFPIGSTAVNVTARDAAGNTTAGSFAVNVHDTTAPALSVPSDIVAEATSAAGAAVSYPAATATDAVGVTSLTYSAASGSTFAIGATTVTVTASDAAGNASVGTFNITVQDTTAPTLAVSSNIVAEATSAAGAIVSYPAATATDAVGVTSLTYSVPSGSIFPLGTTTVTVTASDAAGNSTSSAFAISVLDTTAPVISAPANIVAEATSAAGAAVSYPAATATDAVGVTSLTYSTDSGSMFAIGTTTVTVTASDASGNLSTASFTITVNDTTAPIITAPANIVAEASSAAGAAVSYPAATATDAVGVTSLTYGTDSGSTFALGTSTVTVTATDAAGNVSTASFTITVSDTTAPAITAPANIVAEATSAAGATVSYPAASATDAVGVTSLTYGTDSGSTFAIGTSTVTITATDAAGNVSTASFTITVSDTTAPVVTAPANIVAEATSAAGAAVSYPAAIATDIVGVTSLTYSAASGSTFAIGTTTVTVTAKDAAGNVSTATFTVTVRDTTAPVINAVKPSPRVLWPANNRMVPVTISVDATDLVGVTSSKIISVETNQPDRRVQWQITGALTLNLRAQNKDDDRRRIYTITVEVRDAAGNVTTAKTKVIVPGERDDDDDNDDDDDDDDRKKKKKDPKGKKGDDDDDD